MEIHSSQCRICAYLPRLSSIRVIITHIKMHYCPQKTSRTFIDISPTLPIWKRSCQPFRSYRRVRGLVYLRPGGWLSSDPSLHILVVTTPINTQHICRTLTELLASAHHWNRKHFLPRKHIFSTEKSQTRDPLLFTEQKACVPARGGEKERGKNLHGS